MSRRKMLKKKQLQCFIRKRVISKFYQDKIFFKKEKRNCFYKLYSFLCGCVLFFGSQKMGNCTSVNLRIKQ